MTGLLVQLTSRPRPGRRFEPVHELALLEPALEACRALPGAARGLTVVRELTGPIGIPDLTAVVGPVDRLSRRLALGVPPLLNQVDAGVVAVSHAKAPRSAEALAQALGWPAGTLLRRLPGLVRCGALREVRPNRYVRSEELVPVGRLYAVEAKVSDWAGALRQARTYSVWADGYVLVMEEMSPAARQRLHAEVESDRGGLVIGGHWMRRPVLHPLAPASRLWASEHFVAGLRTPTASAR